MNIFILCGVAGSGKSTWAREYQRIHPFTAIISRDEIRNTLRTAHKVTEYFFNENLVFDTFLSAIHTELRLAVNKNLIIDATHLTDKARNQVVKKLCLSAQDTIYYINFILPLDEIKRRNAQRTGYARVPDNVIEGMYKRFKPVREGHYIDIKGE